MSCWTWPTTRCRTWTRCCRPSLGQYAGDHTKAWAEKIAAYDGFVFVTPEYNHSTSGVLKNAIDYLYAEWNNKAAAFVCYGSLGGARAIEHLRAICAELQIAARAPAAVLLAVHRLRELHRVQPRAVAPGHGGSPVRPARDLGGSAQATARQPGGCGMNIAVRIASGLHIEFFPDARQRLSTAINTVSGASLQRSPAEPPRQLGVGKVRILLSRPLGDRPWRLPR